MFNADDIFTDTETSEKTSADVQGETSEIQTGKESDQANGEDIENPGEAVLNSSNVNSVDFVSGYAIKGVIPAGYNDWEYTREYYYHDRELYFAFLFVGSEEYRLYFKDGEVIRYIDAKGTVYNYGNIGGGEQLGESVRLESDALYLGVNCDL